MPRAPLQNELTYLHQEAMHRIARGHLLSGTFAQFGNLYLTILVVFSH